MKVKTLVCGIGINNANYSVAINETVGYTTNGERIRKRVWICPYYRKWACMLERCYSEKFLLKRPTYAGCTVDPEWHYFMNFRAWMVEQDWEGKQLDKDILIPSNKVYGPDTCVFVSQEVNKFLTERQNDRGEYLIGVCFHKASGKFESRCNDVFTRKQKFLGLYDCEEEAHKVWLEFKLEQSYILAAQQTDHRIAKALIERYENYVAL